MSKVDVPSSIPFAVSGEWKILFRNNGLRYDLRECVCVGQLDAEQLKPGDPIMPSVHLVSQEEAPPAAVTSPAFPWSAWGYLAAGAVLLAVIGTWLVWFSAFVQHKFQEEDIRAACQRVMPDTAERCFDTVVIQRGGARR
jgi:hypothetical protein